MLHFKNLGKVWSARVGGHSRALAVKVDGGYLLGFSQAEYIPEVGMIPGGIIAVICGEAGCYGMSDLPMRAILS